MAYFEKPNGVCFFTPEAMDATELSRTLCKIVSFLQSRDPYVQLHRYDDWWEHDGLHFARGRLDFDGLFALLKSPKSLLESTPEDDSVFVGVAPENNQWYLRYRVEWNDEGTALHGECALILDRDYAELFTELEGRTGLKQVDSKAYYADVIL